jgi:D-alanine-D-alanine ligase
MKVGITYDLREDYLAEGYGEEETGEFDRPETIEAIEGTLREFGYQTARIGHIRNLVENLAGGERWDLVFNIAEGLRGLSREAQVPALLDAYGIPYTFSDAFVMSLTLHKAATKRIVRDLGIPTPDFAVVESMGDVSEIDLPFPLFAKPVAEGTGKGISAESRITDRRELERTCRLLLERYRQPAIIETYLPGREFTVGVVGTGRQAKAIGVMEVVLKAEAELHAYSYWNKEKCEDLVNYGLVYGPVAERAKEIALAVHRGLDCRDAGRIDLREDPAGNLSFLEINPLPGLHPLHSDLPILCTMVGMSYRELMANIMKSAVERVSVPPAVQVRK